jgi:hypothetical protein
MSPPDGSTLLLILSGLVKRSMARMQSVAGVKPSVMALLTPLLASLSLPLDSDCYEYENSFPWALLKIGGPNGSRTALSV